MKRTVKSVQVVGNKIVGAKTTVAKEMEPKLVVNGLNIPKTIKFSVAAHVVTAKKLTSDIYKTAVVGHGITVRYAKGKDGQDPYAYGVAYRTLGSNNEFARKIMEHTGDFDNKEVVTHKISIWDRDMQKIKPQYEAVCNDMESKIKYVATDALATIDFSQLQKDIKAVYKEAKPEFIEAKREEVINSVITNGLRVYNDKDGNTRCYIANGVKKAGELYFNMLTWSPSNERSESAVFTSVEPKVAYKIIDKVAGYAISSAIGKTRSISDLIKFSKRLGILGAPAVKMAPFGTEEFGCVIYLGEVEGPEDYNKDGLNALADLGTYIDRNTYDGSTVMLDEYLVACAALLGRKMTKEQARMLALQTRSSVLFTKVFGEGKSLSNMQQRLELLKAMVPAERILRLTPGQDVTGLDKKSYDLIIVGNEDKPAMILDENGSKSIKDIDLKTIAQGNYDNYLLDVAKGTDSATSGQAIQKMLAADKYATLEAMTNLLDAEMDSVLGKKMNDDLDVKNCGLAQFIFRYVDQSNEAALEALVKEELTRVESATQKLRVSVQSLFLRALFDDTYFLTAGKLDGILAKNKYTGRLEAFSLDVELKYEAEITAIYEDASIIDKDEAIAELLTGVAIKFPSPSADENAILTFVTRRQLAERIANMNDLSVELRKLLLDEFIHTSYGVIKLAPNNTIKHRLAGMDTDYDGIAIIFEESLVNIMKAKYPTTEGVTVRIG
ncbi:hypothetical protein [Paraclostridium dentum]|uniref:hypothetical protein n=1 Tax=Paraclostridium dentum TaxID=2662455 RepID=UPI003F2A450E